MVEASHPLPREQVEPSSTSITHKQFPPLVHPWCELVDIPLPEWCDPPRDSTELFLLLSQAFKIDTSSLLPLLNSLTPSPWALAPCVPFLLQCLCWESVKMKKKVEGKGEEQKSQAGYEKRDSSPSPCILLLQDIDFWLVDPVIPHLPVTFTARAREQNLLRIVLLEKSHIRQAGKVQSPSRKKTLQWQRVGSRLWPETGGEEEGYQGRRGQLFLE